MTINSSMLFLLQIFSHPWPLTLVYPLLNSEATPGWSLDWAICIADQELLHNELAVCIPDMFTPCWKVTPHLAGLRSLYTQGSCSLQKLV